MKNSELIKGMYIDEGDVDWVKHRIKFNVQELSQSLIRYKDVFEANKGFGRIDICESKNVSPKTGKKTLYATLNLYKPQPKEEVPVAQHLASREDDDMPF